jgi:threonine/homoserine/homoserine lactone efflux protein
MSFQEWIVFVAAVSAAAMIPGPISILAMSIGVAGDVRAALLGGAGNVVASLVQVTLALCVVIYSLENLERVFWTLAVGGGVFLIFLAVQVMLDDPFKIDIGTGCRGKRLYASPFKRSFVITISNPKAIMFFVALFPQLVSRPRIDANMVAYVLIILITLSIVAFVTFMINAICGLYIRKWLTGSFAAMLVKLVFAVMFLALGGASIVAGLRGAGI